MKWQRVLLCVGGLLTIFVKGYSQAVLNADGPGNTYELITSVLAPGANPVEHPECVHPEFGRHIAEVFDTELNQNVFEFYAHVTPDNDRCINFDRQRVEIKTYDASPESLKGRIGETVIYKWRFRLPTGYRPSNHFTHIHQIKAVGGNDDPPVFTLTPRKGTPNKLELIHDNTTKVAIVNLSSFEGVWVECVESLYVQSTGGYYSLVVKRVSDGVILLSYTNSNIMTIRPDNLFIRPKWGIYRSLMTPAELRDEAVRFNSFSIREHSTSSSGIITTAGSGNWSSTAPGAPWPGGVFPTATDIVVVGDGTELTLDQDATVAALTVGQGSSGIFQTSKTILTSLTINGNLTVNPGGIFRAQSATTSFSGPHTLAISGSITHSGSIFDLRVGTAGTTLGVINTTFTGAGNSTVTMNGAYSSSNGDFNAVTINKSGSGRVILESDMILNSGSSTGPQSMTAILTFVSGIVETGDFTLVAQTSTSANVTGASSASYVFGAMGRGMSNTGGSTKDFPVGDANGYRPINLRSATAGTSTGHHAIVRMISGDANNSSVLSGGINRVSSVRYYRISYSNALGGAATMGFDRFYPSYGTDDGVEAGNTDLRVAYSTDNRGTWTGLGQTINPHTTDLTNQPTQISPDPLAPAITLSNGGNPMFICLANMTGGSNPLPVQLASFTGQYVSQSSVRLTWRTISEVNNYGFMVERRLAIGALWTEVANSFVAGHGTTSLPQSYSYTDPTAGGATLEYRLRQLDMDGSVNYIEPITVSSPTSIKERVPERFELRQNYPNPFNPETSIAFSVARSGRVMLEVFSVVGEKVATIYEGIAEAGMEYKLRFDASTLASGVYVYRLTGVDGLQVKRFTVLR